MDSDGKKWIAIDILSHKMDKRRQQWRTIDRDVQRWKEMDSERYIITQNG